MSKLNMIQLRAAGNFPLWLVLPSWTLEHLMVTFVVIFLLCCGIKQMPIIGWRLGDVRTHHLHIGLLKLFPEPITRCLSILSNCMLKFDSFMLQAPSACCKMSVFPAWGNKLTVWFVLSSHCRKVCLQTFSTFWMDFASRQPPSVKTHASQVTWRLTADHEFQCACSCFHIGLWNCLEVLRPSWPCVLLCNKTLVCHINSKKEVIQGGQSRKCFFWEHRIFLMYAILHLDRAGVHQNFKTAIWIWKSGWFYSQEKFVWRSRHWSYAYFSSLPPIRGTCTCGTWVNDSRFLKEYVLLLYSDQKCLKF